MTTTRVISIAALILGTGAGLATASGARPFLPPLVVGALARADAGIDFEDLSYRGDQVSRMLDGLVRSMVRTTRGPVRGGGRGRLGPPRPHRGGHRRRVARLPRRRQRPRRPPRSARL